MKMRKLILALVLVATLLVVTVLAASAAKMVRVTGGVNYPYRDGPEDEIGWAYYAGNITIDSVTGDAEGFTHYKSYSVEKPKDWGGWNGEAVCGAVGDIDGVPTVVYVVRVVEASDPSWVGKYAKVSITDGGQNAAEDMVGLVVWDLVNGPVEIMPSCDFELPFYAWPGVNGNLTIHD